MAFAHQLLGQRITDLAAADNDDAKTLLCHLIHRYHLTSSM